jgi:hypothetical protein
MASKMVETNVTSIKLPPEVWTFVLSDSELDYFDLKRVQRVSKSFSRLMKVCFIGINLNDASETLLTLRLQSPIFDALLFRSQPTSTPLDCGLKPHPILDDLNILSEYAEDIVVSSGAGVAKKHIVQHLELSRAEMVTHPSSSQVKLQGFGQDGFGSTLRNRDGRGVTVHQLLEEVSALWSEDSGVTYPAPWEMGDFDGRPPTPRLLSVYETVAG